MRQIPWTTLLILFLLGMGVVACAANKSELPVVQVVTVVVTSTPGPTQTPIIITEVQTVVVTVTPTPTRTAVRATMSGDALPNATATATPAPLPTSATRTAQSYKYEAPILLSPPSRVTFEGEAPLLRWEGPTLAEEEYYEVTIERLWQNQPYYSGSDWVKEKQMVVPAFVRGTSDTNQYTWWVTIKRLTGTNAAGGKVGEAISPPSEQRTFTWNRE